MEKKTWIKLFVAVFLVVALSLGLYLRWRPTKLDLGWGRGKLTVSERNFYIGRIGRIIDNWSQTARKLDSDKDGRIKDTCRNFLVIDLDKKALWIEDNGQMLKEYYVEFPSGLKWTFYHSTPKGNTELTGQTFLRFRGFHTGGLNPEFFCLVGQSHNSGHISFHFNGSTKVSDYGARQFTLRPYQFRTITNSENLYGSMIVTEDEYQQYRDSLPYLIVSQTNEDNAQSEILSELEANKAAWSRIEKHLYMEIDRQVQAAGYELRRLTVEPSLDFTEGHSKFVYFRSSIMYKLFDGSISALKSYLIINHLGDDIWYVKSGIDPEDPVISSNNFEFLVSLPNKNIQSTQHNELLQKGRKIQQSGTIPESKWKSNNHSDFFISSNRSLEVGSLVNNSSSLSQAYSSQ